MRQLRVESGGGAHALGHDHCNGGGACCRGGTHWTCTRSGKRAWTMAKAFLLDVEERKGITSLAKGVDESVDKSLFPTIQRRPNGSFIVMVSPASTGKKLDWLYAKDNKGMIIDYKQFQNKAENSYSNSISGQESDHHVHTLEIGTKSVPPYSLKQEGSSVKVHPLVTDVTPYAVWSTEDVYMGMPLKNMTAEEAEFQNTFEWAKKALSEDADGASDNNNRMSISA